MKMAIPLKYMRANEVLRAAAEATGGSSISIQRPLEFSDAAGFVARFEWPGVVSVFDQAGCLVVRSRPGLPLMVETAPGFKARSAG